MIVREALPREIIASNRAVVWRYELRDGRRTKVPYMATRPGVRAAVDRPATWGSFAEALAAVGRGVADGAGVVLGDGLAGVDLDHVVDGGIISEVALQIIREIASYSEFSPSGAGVHVLVRGTLPPGGRRRGCIEMYCDGRFFTVTGQHVVGTPATIEEGTAALAVLHCRIFAQPAPRERHAGAVRPVALDDVALLERARAARNGTKFAALWSGDTSGYPSHSEADQALCNLLSFWTRSDRVRIDRLFRSSGLMREKWDAQHGEQTYGDRTIALAIAGTAS